MSGLAGMGSEEINVYLPTHAGIYGNDSVLARFGRGIPDQRGRIEAALDQVAPNLADFMIPMDDALALQILA